MVLMIEKRMDAFVRLQATRAGILFLSQVLMCDLVANACYALLWEVEYDAQTLLFHACVTLMKEDLLLQMFAFWRFVGLYRAGDRNWKDLNILNNLKCYINTGL